MFDKSVRWAIALVEVLGLIWGGTMIYKLIASKGNMPMTTEQAILSWGAFFLIVGFFASLIVYTVFFFFCPSLARQNGEETTKELVRKHGERLSNLENKISLLLKNPSRQAMKVVSIVGMAGSGKSEVAKVFEESGFRRIRFGDITDEEIKKRGLELNEENERCVRQQLRKEHGMSVYAKLNLPRIDALLKLSDVVVDGLYSWEEYTLLKNRYGDNFHVVAVWASPQARYERLMKRPVRPLKMEEAISRDMAELENTNKGGPIAMADFVITNESSLRDLEKQTKMIVSALK